MNKLLRSFLIILALAQTASAQMTAQSASKPSPRVQIVKERTTGAYITNVPGVAKAAPVENITLPNAHYMGMTSKFPFQTTGRGLHTIQVDPSNPQRIHAVMMADPTTNASDTGGTVTYPQRRVFYTYSGNGGVTWSTPVSISATRAGYPDMLLYNNGTNYLPIVAMHVRETDADDYHSSIYIGKGEPGAVTFTEVAASRTPAEVIGDRDIIWPSIAISPDQKTVYMMGSIILETGETEGFPMQFSTFTIEPSAGTGTWNGPWKVGPGVDQSRIETGGDYALAVSPSGKLGVMWGGEKASNYAMFFSESSDKGENWSLAEYGIFEQTGGLGTNSSSILVPTDGFDMFYEGEKAHLVWAAYPISEDGTLYYPGLGAIMYWNSAASEARILAAVTNFKSDLPDPDWFIGELGQLGGTIETQGASIEYAVVGRSQDAKKWTIFFNTYRDADTTEPFIYDTRGTEDTSTYVYRSIMAMTTLDGGASFGEPFVVLANDQAASQAERLDFRYPAVSDWNPQSGDNVLYQTMITVDSAAGIPTIGGLPIWSFNQYFHKEVAVNIGGALVHRTGTTDNLSLEQNFPNPFNPSTSVAFSVKEAAQVRLVVEDMMGREVAVAFEGMATPGHQQKVKIDASNLPSGVYQYVLKTENESVARRMVLSK